MKRNSWLIFIFCFSSSLAQVNTAFLDHLSATGLRREHQAYLNTLPAQNDSTAYAKAKFYLKYFNDSLFLSNYSAAANLCVVDSAMNAQADQLFLSGSSVKIRDRWFNDIHTHEKNKSDIYFHIIYKASVNPNLYAKDIFVPELQTSFVSYKRIYNKKPVLGAVFSALVPGLGKLYAGKAKSSLLTFLLNAGYAAQTLESAQKLGIKHPFTIVNAAIFTVFYLANVYGGYADIVTLKKERKKQFVTDATRLYN